MGTRDGERCFLAFGDSSLELPFSLRCRKRSHSECLLPSMVIEPFDRRHQRFERLSRGMQIVAAPSKPECTTIWQGNQLRLLLVTAYSYVPYVLREGSETLGRGVVFMRGINFRCDVPDPREHTTGSKPHRRGSQHRQVIRLLVPSPIFSCCDPYRRADRGYGSDGLRPTCPIAGTKFGPGHVFVADRTQKHRADHGHIPVDDLLHLYPVFFEAS